MTEADWNNCNDPALMLTFLRGNVSQRKLRLFACACCRRAWHDKVHPAVLTAERFADGLVGRQDLIDAEFKIGALGSYSALAYASNAAAAVLNDVPSAAADWAARNSSVSFALAAVHDFITSDNKDVMEAARAQELHVQAALLRDIVGNPFRPLPLLNWRTPAILNLAREAYDDRIMPAGTLDNARLAALAALLQEAGCDDAELLNHLRAPAPHYRGCFALDLVLGKA